MSALDDTVGVFQGWLDLPDPNALYAALGTVAANKLEGDPVWLVIVGAPSSGKTEILQAIASLEGVHPTASLTEAGLLSGSPKRERAKGATGGLLRKVGPHGIILAKDFGSVLSLHADARAQVLAALREIYDGAWTRNLGTDGGQSLHWEGKCGLIAGCTPVIDRHQAVMGAMGERFIMHRLAPVDAAQQAQKALERHREVDERSRRQGGSPRRPPAQRRRRHGTRGHPEPRKDGGVMAQRDAQGRRINPAHQPLIRDAEKLHRGEREAAAGMERARVVYLHELDAWIDHQRAEEEHERANGKDRPLTASELEALLGRREREKEHAQTTPRPPVPRFTQICRNEMAQRREERGLPPARLSLPVPEAVTKARARLEEASGNIWRIRASAATPEASGVAERVGAPV